MILRPATFADEKLLLDWRNDPTVLAVSTNSLPATPEGHHAWLSRILSQHDETRLYIAEVDGVPVGQGRIERAWKAISRKMDTCMIGYSIGREHRGHGYGTHLATELVTLARAAGYYTVGCRIQHANMPSIVVALRAGVNAIEIF